MEFDNDLPELVRFRLQPTLGRVVSERLDATPQEFPRINPRRSGLPHRYGYTVQIADDQGRGFCGLLQHDLQRGTRKVHRLQHGRAPGEGVFVPVGAGEDEGYVLSVVYDPDRNQSDVIVLDASRFDAAPVATIQLPVRIPFGFHGDWVR